MFEPYDSEASSDSSSMNRHSEHGLVCTFALNVRIFTEHTCALALNGNGYVQIKYLIVLMNLGLSMSKRTKEMVIFIFVDLLFTPYSTFSLKFARGSGVSH